ncbi:MAG: fibronectin type III domain-containing protein [Dorea sp.]|nr:fibronectin type III domain-containing protein [Dorea sp.]
MKRKKLLSLFLAAAMTVSSFAMWDASELSGLDAMNTVYAEEANADEAITADSESMTEVTEDAADQTMDAEPADTCISEDAEFTTEAGEDTFSEEVEDTNDLLVPVETNIEFSVPVPKYGNKITNEIRTPENAPYQVYDVQWTKESNQGTYIPKEGEYMDNGLYTIRFKIAPMEGYDFSNMTAANVNSRVKPDFYDENGSVANVMDSLNTPSVFLPTNKAYIQWTYTFNTRRISDNHWKVMMPSCVEINLEDSTMDLNLPAVFNNKNQLQDPSQFHFEWLTMERVTGADQIARTKSVETLCYDGWATIPFAKNDAYLYRCVVTKDGSFIGQIDVDAEEPVFERADEYYIIPNESSFPVQILFQDEDGEIVTNDDYSYDWYKCDSPDCEINANAIYLGQKSTLYVANGMSGYGNADMNGHNMYLKCIYSEGACYRGEVTFSLYPEITPLDEKPVATLTETEAYLSMTAPAEAHFYSLYLENVTYIAVYEMTEEGEEFIEEYEPVDPDEEIYIDIDPGVEYGFYVQTNIKPDRGSESASVILRRDGQRYSKNQTFTFTNKTKKATLTADGYKYKECGTCGYGTITKMIPMVSSVTLSATSYTYDGKAKKPTVTVTNSDGKVLTLNTDYTVSYEAGRTNIGSYKVTVKGKGNYSYTKTLTFKVVPTKTSITKLTAAAKAFTATWNKKTSQVTGYQVQYSTSSDFKTDAKLLTVTSYKTATATFKSLKAKKKYYVRIRTYKTVNGTKITSGWSAVKTVTTK